MDTKDSEYSGETADFHQVLGSDPAAAACATPKPQKGQWRLVAPDGREFIADSPIKCAQAEQGERVPAHVGLARIANMLNEATK